MPPHRPGWPRTRDRRHSHTSSTVAPLMQKNRSALAQAGHPRLPFHVAGKSNALARRAPPLAGRQAVYVVSPFLAAGPFMTPNSGAAASITLSANFRWEVRSCSAKS